MSDIVGVEFSNALCSVQIQDFGGQRRLRPPGHEGRRPDELDAFRPLRDLARRTEFSPIPAGIADLLQDNRSDRFENRVESLVLGRIRAEISTLAASGVLRVLRLRPAVPEHRYAASAYHERAQRQLGLAGNSQETKNASIPER